MIEVIAVLALSVHSASDHPILRPRPPLTTSRPPRPTMDVTHKHKDNSDLVYDAALVFWRVVTNIFFREVRPRGAFNIPREGPVIFVAAPHNNQVRAAYLGCFAAYSVYQSVPRPSYFVSRST